ncbi:LysR family transcriptional regulator [Phytoactinopolyspora endophytica]|uniref:LysR family transcriptional regulator n=1 Tax=Phytoactinopolyspora endophytica TaxID=1642495 RepID=UPI00101B84C1|nr:LysR family transcriptional regulator [Phytoactinopolyspora endophytica]
MNITLQQLEFFRTVARHLSFSNAAKELYTSQPYVSNQIRRLEDHYGVPLFVRSHPRISLTEAGQALYERIERILDDVGELEHVVQQFQGLHRGTITLAATASAGNHVIPDMIASFKREYPDIVVRARVGNTEDVQEWLGLDEAEIGVTPQQPQNGPMICEPFYTEALVVIAPVAMDLPESVSVAELAALPKVIREDGSLTLTKMNRLLEDYPYGTDFVAQFGGTTAVNEAVAAGLGVSIVPERSAKPWLDAGSVRTVTLPDVAMDHSFYLVYSQQRYITPATRTLIEHLRRNAHS